MVCTKYWCKDISKDCLRSHISAWALQSWKTQQSVSMFVVCQQFLFAPTVPLIASRTLTSFGAELDHLTGEKALYSVFSYDRRQKKRLRHIWTCEISRVWQFTENILFLFRACDLCTFDSCLCVLGSVFCVESLLPLCLESSSAT